MAEIIPIKGIRYNSKDLSKLICPPYDVISPEEKKQLLSSSGCNFVRVEFPENAKTANKFFTDWQKKNVLVTEKEPALYVYQQGFPFKKKEITRTGFLCATRLSASNTLKHEKTTDKPIEQRFNLLKEVQGNTSPVFCLFPDKDKSVSRILQKTTKSKPYAAFKDRENITHKIWILTDRKTTAKITASLGKKYLMIADGHHRHKTGLMYMEYMLSKMKAKPDKKPFEYILTFLCAVEDPGLLILPTHRVVKKYPGIKDKITRYFNFRKWDGKSKPQITCFCDGEFKILDLKNKNIFGKQSKLYKSIPAIVLQKLVLNGVSAEDIFYTKSTDEAVRKAGQANSYAFLLESPSLESIFSLSKIGEIMPPKTTYFFPKIPAGLVVHSLKY